VSGPSCRRHDIQGFAEQVANFGVLRVSWWGRYVNLSIMAITREKFTLNECLANVDVIRKHVMLSGESQHKAKTAGVRHRTKAVLKITRARCILLFHVLSLHDKTDLAALSISAFSASSHRDERA
jgi:RAB protein geranylgeranyltransferase component A